MPLHGTLILARLGCPRRDRLAERVLPADPHRAPGQASSLGVRRLKRRRSARGGRVSRPRGITGGSEWYGEGLLYGLSPWRPGEAGANNQGRKDTRLPQFGLVALFILPRIERDGVFGQLVL